MAACETCGNGYNKAVQVTKIGHTHTDDSLGYAIQALTPTCAHCGYPIIGHGVEQGSAIFCCAHCTGTAGNSAVRDRA